MNRPLVLVAKASNAEIISAIDQWIGLLSQRKFAEALAIISSEPFWNAELLAEIIDSYDDGEHNQVTLTNDGTSIDGAGNISLFKQRKEVDWFDGERGAVWYDLNINGRVSDLTATFDLERSTEHLFLRLHDIHMM
jgi:hypothetical protein